MIEYSPTFKNPKQPSGLSKLIFLAILILGGMLLSSGLSFLIWNLAEIDINDVLKGKELSRNERIHFRIGLMVNHAGTFLIPALLYCVLVLKGRSELLLQLKNKPVPSEVMIWGLIILFSYPIIAALAHWNLSLPLPDWMKTSQSDSLALVEQTLTMEGLTELSLSIILVGLLAALGEELIFRGILQRTFEFVWNNAHLAIIVAAICFGAFHMQFERIFPLSFLGIILGYSYYYTRSLLVPVILHFLNNSIQVISIYILAQRGTMPEIDHIPEISYSLLLISLVITTTLIFTAVRLSAQKNESRP